MNLFRRPDYQSEVTQFIDHLKAKNPELEAQQKAGRALLWDKTIDRQQARQIAAGSVAQRPYVYGTQ